MIPTFQWQCEPKAEELALRLLTECCRSNETLAKLQKDLEKHTSSRLLDWVDHLMAAFSSSLEKELLESGYQPQHAGASYRVFSHPGAQLPRIALYDNEKSGRGVAVAVDSIADFLMMQAELAWLEGSSLSGYRRACVATENNTSFWVVERRGTETLEPLYQEGNFAEKVLGAIEKWKTRPRYLEEEEIALRHAFIIAEEIVSLFGIDYTAWLVLAAERDFWQMKNTAGQMQKSRQDRLGMGWANHDHHTFRSTRRHFQHLVRFFEMLGFHCRERFYAGAEAGWGAQVMENPRAELVLFLDVDLSPEEMEIDFAHHPLPELPSLGTIGLWCELHGESILQGGMHHLEAQFLFEDLAHDLGEKGIKVMEPFSNFSYLKQAFTEGEIWPVNPIRIEKLLKEGKITLPQAEKFRQEGALGSHLENLQRREGYKGFNQKNVSSIIKKTDPRTTPPAGGA